MALKFDFNFDFTRIGFKQNFTLDEYISWKNSNDFTTFKTKCYEDYYLIRTTGNYASNRGDWYIPKEQKPLASGTFGSVYLSKNNQNIIKVIDINDNTGMNIFRLFDECLIQLILYEKTQLSEFVQERQRNHVMARVPRILHVGLKKGNKFFIVMEKLDNNLSSVFNSMINESDNDGKKTLKFAIILYQISSLMKYLRDYFNFSHGDFKTNNVMIKYLDNEIFDIYIIDYGFSNIKFEMSNGNKYSFGSEETNSCYFEGRDLIMFVYWIFYDSCQRFRNINENCQELPQIIHQFIYKIIRCSNFNIKKFDIITRNDRSGIGWYTLYNQLNKPLYNRDKNVQISYEWVKRASKEIIKAQLALNSDSTILKNDNGDSWKQWDDENQLFNDLEKDFDDLEKDNKNLNDKITRLEKEKNASEQKIRTLESTIDNLKSDKKNLENEKNASEDKIRTLETTINNLESDKIKLENDKNASENQIRTLKSTIRDLESDKKELENGRDVLNQQITSLNTKIDKLESDNQTQNNSLNQQKTDLESTIKILKSEKNNLENKNNALNTRIGNLETEKNKLNSIQKQLENEKNTIANELKKITEDREQILKQIPRFQLLIGTKNTFLEKLNERVAELQADLEIQRKKVEEKDNLIHELNTKLESKTRQQLLKKLTRNQPQEPAVPSAVQYGRRRRFRSKR